MYPFSEDEGTMTVWMHKLMMTIVLATKTRYKMPFFIIDCFIQFKHWMDIKCWMDIKEAAKTVSEAVKTVRYQNKQVLNGHKEM